MLIRSSNNNTIFKMNTNTNRITMFTSFNYAFQSYYNNGDMDYIPGGNGQNPHLILFSTTPCRVTVDWGDGLVENFDFIYNAAHRRYVCAWKSLNTDLYNINGEGVLGLGWYNYLGYDSDRNYIKPYPNHHYLDDDVTKSREITFTFIGGQVYYARMFFLIQTQFPIMETYDIKEFILANPRYITSIPFNRINRMVKLRSLQLQNFGNRISEIPEALFSLPNLEIVNVISLFDLSDIETSNIRLVKNAKKLITLNIRNCNLTKYIKEFNELPNIESLLMTPYDPDLTPDMSEVTSINPNLKAWGIIDESASFSGIRRTNWADWISGYGLENLHTLSIRQQPNMPVDALPEYIKEMRSLGTTKLIGQGFNVSECLRTQERADTFVNTFYDYITNWSEITMSQTALDGLRNQFYGLGVRIYNPSYGNTDNYRPSGEYQAPDGFVEGVSNGTPTTPMEKIYVLTKNYTQEWTVNPNVAPYTTRSLIINNELSNKKFDEHGRIWDDSMIYSKGEPYQINRFVEVDDLYYQ